MARPSSEVGCVGGEGEVDLSSSAGQLETTNVDTTDGEEEGEEAEEMEGTLAPFRHLRALERAAASHIRSTELVTAGTSVGRSKSSSLSPPPPPPLSSSFPRTAVSLIFAAPVASSVSVFDVFLPPSLSGTSEDGQTRGPPAPASPTSSPVNSLRYPRVVARSDG